MDLEAFKEILKYLKGFLGILTDLKGFKGFFWIFRDFEGLRNFKGLTLFRFV